MPQVSRYNVRKGLVCLLLLFTGCLATAQYKLQIEPVDRDTVFLTRTLGLQTNFISRLPCQQYIDNLPALLQAKGYATASIDSVWVDSSHAFVKLFVGEAYKLVSIDTRQADRKVLEQAGWNEKKLFNKPFK